MHDHRIPNSSDSAAELPEILHQMAHDVSAPIRHVRDFTKLLLDSSGIELTPDQQKYKFFIDQGILSLELIQKGLANYANVAQSIPKLQSCDLVPLINSIKPIKPILIECAASKIELVSDVSYLTQLCQLIIDNAAVYCSKDRNAKVNITYRQTSISNKEFIQLSFKDNGIGMDEAALSCVTKPLKRLSKTEPAAGMGLAICELICNRLGGSLTLSSMVDQSTTVNVYLPLEHATTL